MACGFFLTALDCVQMSQHSKLGDIKLLVGAETYFKKNKDQQM